MVRGNVEIIELLDSDDDNAQVDENNGNEDDGDVEEVQVARAVRGAVGADDEDEDLVVTGAFETRHPKFLFFCFFFVPAHLSFPPPKAFVVVERANHCVYASRVPSYVCWRFTTLFFLGHMGHMKVHLQ